MLHGLLVAVTPQTLFWISVGVLAGMVVGTLPGLTATMGVALLVPFTFDLPAADGLAMLGALFVCAMFSDAVPAVLVNTPGTPAAMATAFDGFPMAKQGRAQHAIVASCFSAMLGAVFGGLVFVFVAGPLGRVALRFGPPEFFWVGVFAVTIVGSLSGESLVEGVAGAAIGMLIRTIGLSQTGDVARFTFGLPELRGGVSLVAALIGVFAIPQVLEMVAERRGHEFVGEYRTQRGVVLQVVREILSQPVHFLRSAGIGTLVGLLPGGGPPVAALLSYNEAVRWTRGKKNFGQGDMRGVTASEFANNACAPASMIPMVTLGVPGSGVAAVISGALLMRGLHPGPSLFATQASLVYTFAWSMTLSGIVTYVFGSLLSPVLARMIKIPVRLLAPIIVFLCSIGSFAIRNSIADVYWMLGLGIFAYVVSKLGIRPGPIGLGLILGPILEPALVQSIALSHASSAVHVFFGSGVDIVMVCLTALSLAWMVWSHRRSRVQAPALATGGGPALAAGAVHAGAPGAGGPVRPASRGAPGPERQASDAAGAGPQPGEASQR
jgi:putative tricarboxylic transport membrane protein